MTRQRLQASLASWDAAKARDDELSMYVAGQRMAHAIQEVIDEEAGSGVAEEVALRLAARPHHHVPIDTIRAWCVEAEQHFADAPIRSFVPILMENMVSNRMIEGEVA